MLALPMLQCIGIRMWIGNAFAWSQERVQALLSDVGPLNNVCLLKKPLFGRKN
jgi:hypothetical protein